MARPVAHFPWTGVETTHRRAMRVTPSGYSEPVTPYEGPKGRPQTRKFTTGGCRFVRRPTEKSSRFRAGRLSSIGASQPLTPAGPVQSVSNSSTTLAETYNCLSFVCIWLTSRRRSGVESPIPPKTLESIRSASGNGWSGGTSTSFGRPLSLVRTRTDCLEAYARVRHVRTGRR